MGFIKNSVKNRLKQATDGCYSGYTLQLEKVCKELKLDCYDAEFKDPKMSGAIYKEDASGKFTIYVNATHPLTRKRFTVAHEIGHYISFLENSYSKAQLASEGFEDYAISFRHEGVKSKAENEANIIAAEMLMPAEFIQKMYEQGLTPEQMAKEFCVSEISLTLRLQSLYPDIIID